ncbi:MAG: DNA repair protein RecO [Elusimicrobia bacterium]|nr:DNA repair protein RecO [Elusimicrobiota bacterium]
MIVTTPGVVIDQWNIQESDRLVILYTEALGKLAVRFAGVLKPHAKLRALSEPLVAGDYRLYMRSAAPHAKAVGGAVLTAHPRLRTSLSKMAQAFHFCELLNRLTPEQQPSGEKFSLITEALAALQDGDGAWIGPAYALRLLDLAGFGLRHWPPKNIPALNAALISEAWRRLHHAPLAELGRAAAHPRILGFFNGLVDRHLQMTLDRPLKTTEFKNELSRTIVDPAAFLDEAGLLAAPSA